MANKHLLVPLLLIFLLLQDSTLFMKNKLEGATCRPRLLGGRHVLFLVEGVRLTRLLEKIGQNELKPIFNIGQMDKNYRR